MNPFQHLLKKPTRQAVELIDREVRLSGSWENGKPGGRQFLAGNARALAEGCGWKGR
jgi:hypothetical protein